MKAKHFLLSLFFIVQVLSAQNYQTIEEVDNACATLGFSANEDAEIAVDNILDQIGIPRNFTIQECPNINNAVAKIIESSSGVKERYILFDGNFFRNMNDKAGSEWAAKSILAHEIGHHLSGHALNNKGSNHQFELEADEFSGFVLAKLGATLEEAQSAIQTLRYEKETSTHPAKADRLLVIERGWNRGSGNAVVITKKEEEKTEALLLYEKGEKAYSNNNFEDAIHFFKEAKRLGNSDAYYYLSNLYYLGFGVIKDDKKAYELAKEGYELGSIPATYQLGKYLARGIGVAENKEDSDRLFQKDFQIKWFKKQYDKNKLPYHAYAIGFMYGEGYGGVKKDDDQSIFWYKIAASEGDIIAQFNLGIMYYYGKNGVQKDKAEALKWYQKSAEQNYSSAQYNLGRMYFRGSEVTKDYEEAVYWYRKAAKQDNSKAQNSLGNMFKMGYGVPQDYTKAIEWYRKAAEQNNASAQNSLGYLYVKGFGVKKNYKEAVYWYRKSANQDFSRAQFNLAVSYKNGYGVTEDYDEAIYWYKKAAKQGFKRAQEYLTKNGKSW